jgi:hypothetical protein
VINADYSRTETVSDYSAGGSLESQTVTITSADGLSVTTETDSSGNGTFDWTRTDVTVSLGFRHTQLLHDCRGETVNADRLETTIHRPCAQIFTTGYKPISPPEPA